MTREEAAKELQIYAENSWGGLNESFKLAIVALREPEHKCGQWEYYDIDNSYYCTACGEIWALDYGTPEENSMNFCPNCCADMRDK